MTSNSTDKSTFPSDRPMLGIVGGFGPFAHVYFEKYLLDAANRKLGARRDQDFPAWIVSSYTETPDRVRYILGSGDNALPGLIESFQRLETFTRPDGKVVRGADFAVLTCITAHALLPQVLPHISIPVVNMVDLTAAHIAKTFGKGKVGVLATNATLRTSLFQNALKKYGLEAVTPLDLRDGEWLQDELVMYAIYGDWRADGPASGGIKGCGVVPEYVAALVKAAGMLREQCGAEMIIGGCTEIDQALTQSGYDQLPLISPYAILTDEIFRRVYGRTE